MTGRAVFVYQRVTGFVAGGAGRSHPTVQAGAMAKGAGGIQLSGCFMAVGGCARPERNRVGSVGRMAFLTTFVKTADGDIEARVAPRTAVERLGVALLAIGEIGLGLRSMQIAIGKRQRVRSTGTPRMTARGHTVGISEIGRKAAGSVRIGRCSPGSKVVTDRTVRILLTGIAVTRCIGRRVVVGALPAGGVRTGDRVASGR